MKNKIIIVIVLIILIALLFFVSNYINTETIKMATSSISGETKNIISGEKVSLEKFSNLINSKEEFEEKVLNSSNKVLVDFYADWCGPCQIMAPILDEFISNHPEIQYYKVNVDENEELSTRYRILYIPTMIVFESGDAKNRCTGVVETSQLEELIK